VTAGETGEKVEDEPERKEIGYRHRDCTASEKCRRDEHLQDTSHATRCWI